jgi:lipoprotein-anchoring transpeptidase ErfK/SrfK
MAALTVAGLAAGTDAALAQERVPPRPVQLAQAHVFDVYVDGQGREVIVDSQTGQVVEIRPPGGGMANRGFYPAPPPPVQLPRTLGRDSYDMSDPRDVRRLRRDREIELGRREPPPIDRDIYDDYDRPDGDDYDSGAYPEPPVQDFNDGYSRDAIRRAPLGSPLDQPGMAGEDEDDSEFAAVPDSSDDDASVMKTPEAQSLQPEELKPFVPSHGISVPGARGASEAVASYQVLLDRAGASPGVIDGRMGDNVNKAIDAYQKITGRRLKTYDKEWIKEQLEATGGPAFMEYTITNEDAAGPYIASVPSDYSKKAELKRLGYTSVTEMLAERFHMDEDYLKSLNPQANFKRPGTIIKVVNPGKPVEGEVASIVADKSLEQVQAYNAEGELIAAYPATIGSTDTPSPSGTHAVDRVAFNPEYTYNPKINFKQGSNDEILTIPPGPNGPVGTVWIALDKPTYGVHGTPEPSTIGKTSSHGCVRLTNWDAQELAKMVEPGVTVEFVK